MDEGMAIGVKLPAADRVLHDDRHGEVVAHRLERSTCVEQVNDPACDRLEERSARRHVAYAEQQHRDEQRR